MFHSAALKLTGWYLIIIMALSVGSSWTFYRLSSTDLKLNANRQIDFYRGLFNPHDIDNLSQLRLRQLDQDLQHLKLNLVIFNLFVLIAGGAASYALARRSLKPIEDSLEAQKRFTSDASHELRTPLTAIQTENEVALRSRNLTKEQAVNLLKSNLEEVAKLKALSEGLLALATNDGVENLDQNVSLKDVTEQAMERVSKAARLKKIKLENDVKSLKVKGNPQSLTDLIAILLDNAIKYSPAGSKVSINSEKKDKSAVITVKDKGRGIAKSDLPHIFERFYRADASRNKQQAEGYGLGLAIAKKIVDLHSGSIDVNSTPRKGSTFIIRLPAA